MLTKITHNGTDLNLSTDYEVIAFVATKGGSYLRITKRVPSVTDVDSNLAGLFSAHQQSASIAVVVHSVDDDNNEVEIHNETYTKIMYYQIVFNGLKTDIINFVQ